MNSMQIIQPDMFPIVGGIMLIILILIGLVAIALIVSGLMSWKAKDRKTAPFVKLLIGAILASFVLYNWIGYNTAFNESEMELVGKYRCMETSDVLIIKNDNTWLLKGSEFPCSKGKWNHAMGDMVFWNIYSDQGCHTQTFTSDWILFNDQGMKFIKFK